MCTLLDAAASASNGCVLNGLFAAGLPSIRVFVVNPVLTHRCLLVGRIIATRACCQECRFLLAGKPRFLIFITHLHNLTVPKGFFGHMSTCMTLFPLTSPMCFRLIPNTLGLRAAPAATIFWTVPTQPTAKRYHVSYRKSATVIKKII